VCRFAVYLGPDGGLSRFLLEPDHSLVKQAWQPREMQTALLNADGFGFGWYNHIEPAAYRNVLPIWADPNLASLGRSLERGLWLAHVRSATPGFGAGLANTQPFTDDELMFVHNGFITDFATRIRQPLRRWLAPAIEAGIGGNTDSEHLFAILRQLLLEDDERDLTDAMRLMHGLLIEWGAEHALLNLALTDGGRVVALRHALGSECPSLYFTTDDDMFPGAQLLASEPLTETGVWQTVPPHHLLTLDPDEPPQLTPL
jgi:glutamine amidotransferase